MKTFKQILWESTDKFRNERERRRAAGLPQPDSEYIGRGHDSFQDDNLSKRQKDELKRIIADVWGVHGGSTRLPDLWAAGPTIKIHPENGDKLVSVRSLNGNRELIHTDIFGTEMTGDRDKGQPPNPTMFGRIDHVRKEITMNMEKRHKPFFSSSAQDRISKELSDRHPGYDVVDLSWEP